MKYSLLSLVRTAHAREIVLASALFLFLELALIRWLPAEVLYLTFFTNVVLLASFLGLSLGCLIARRSTDWLAWTPALLVGLLAAGGGMEWLRLTLQNVINLGNNATSPQVVYFGGELRRGDVASFIVPIELVAGIFFLFVALTMVGLGQRIGRLFATFPDPVAGYIANVAGSLMGIAAFTACSWRLSPMWWFGVVSAGLIYLLLKSPSRAWWAIALAALAPLVLIPPQRLHLGIIRTLFPEEFWSPYYRINYLPKSGTIVANLIGQQSMISRNAPYPAYAIPYLLNRDSGEPVFHDILIVGAGSGNDLSRALQWSTADLHVDAVEIDPVIQKLGALDHPDHPYQDRRVSVHIADGRNFLRSTDRRYDLIIFALVDSLVLHSSVSNLRLESYLFTREAFLDVRNRLKPDGLFVVYNYFRQGWIVSRLDETLRDSFGHAPVVLTLPFQDRVRADSKADAFTIFFAGPREEAIEDAFRKNGSYLIAKETAPSPASPNGFKLPFAPGLIRLGPAEVEIPADLQEPRDSWPFLYLRNPMIPELSWRGIAVLAAVSIGLLWLFSERRGLSRPVAVNLRLFLLGAGFMLLETKAVVHMALIYGGTWLVNTVVFFVLLLMVLLANLWVEKHTSKHVGGFYAALLASLALNVAVPLSAFLGQSRLLQGISAGALLLSPVFFAGVIFARTFARASESDQALAWNVAGAVCGGLAENVSLLIGFRWLLAVAAAIYAASLAAAWPEQAKNRS